LRRGADALAVGVARRVGAFRRALSPVRRPRGPATRATGFRVGFRAVRFAGGFAVLLVPLRAGFLAATDEDLPAVFFAARFGLARGTGRPARFARVRAGRARPLVVRRPARFVRFFAAARATRVPIR